MMTFELLLALLALSLGLALIARRLMLPDAVALVLGGIAVGFIPGLPRIALGPELALALFLSPLLQRSGYRTDWAAFRSRLRPILLLALGAILFTAAAVALVARWLVPELPWGAAIALGAIVAPPDAVAASAVLKTVKPPRHIVTVLQGESLLNDASSLVLYRFAVAATMAGSFAWGQGALTFILSGAGGVLTGYVIGRIAMWVFAHLDDTQHDIAVSVLAGYAAYLLAEWLHVSGVLGVVSCGLVLGRNQHLAFSARTRIGSRAVWDFIDFVLTSLVFMLIGMQLPDIVHRLDGDDAGRLAVLALSLAVTLIASRFVWIIPMAWLPRLLSRSLRETDPAPSMAELTVLSWAGMRGVVSLAAALALPTGFPGRDLIVFLAFCAIFATLVVQGTTLGPLIRRLGVSRADNGHDPERASVRHDALFAALSAMEQRLSDPEHREAATALAKEYRERAEEIARLDDDEHGGEEDQSATRRLGLRLDAIDAARSALAEARDEHSDEASRTLIEELDLEEERIRREMGER